MEERLGIAEQGMEQAQEARDDAEVGAVVSSKLDMEERLVIAEQGMEQAQDARDDAELLLFSPSRARAVQA
ncbi:hypothetical protein T484DRAFT_1806482 [Baffinella frigidus]|nr:hypothetical protein T484DRAFT_1806482 [Cryptophyta sp. CCMP2293]